MKLNKPMINETRLQHKKEQKEKTMKDTFSSEVVLNKVPKA